MSKKVKLNDQLKVKGLIIRYYILSDIFGMPKITICLIRLGRIICRGIAFCSDSEQRDCGFIESEGKTLARHRAFKAWNKQKHVDIICREISFRNDISLIDGGYNFDTYFKYKGMYNASLTNNEKLLFPELEIPVIILGTDQEVKIYKDKITLNENGIEISDIPQEIVPEKDNYCENTE